MNTLLHVDAIDVHYGEVQALHGVSLEVKAGEIVALIGANGAGKSTVLRTVSGLLKPTRGEIWLEGQPVGGRDATALVRAGVSHVPEGRRIFPGLSIYENLELATTPWFQRGMDIRENLEEVYALFPFLKKRREQSGWSLSGGEQQMLAIGRALMARPRLILMDEPSLGLAPTLVQEVFRIIERINAAGTAILLVEQNAFQALQVAHRGYVLANGHIILSDEARVLAKDPAVRKAYLGG